MEVFILNTHENNDSNRRKELSQKFGMNLWELRKNRGLSREQLAEMSNLSTNYIYGLEHGSFLPGFMAIIDLSNSLNTTPSQLLDKYINNKKNFFVEQISQNLDCLTDRDLDLILNIVEFCCNRDKNK